MSQLLAEVSTHTTQGFHFCICFGPAEIQHHFRLEAACYKQIYDLRCSRHCWGSGEILVRAAKKLKSGFGEHINESIQDKRKYNVISFPISTINATENQTSKWKKVSKLVPTFFRVSLLSLFSKIIPLHYYICFKSGRQTIFCGAFLCDSVFFTEWLLLGI